MRFLYFVFSSSMLILLVLLIRTFLRKQLSPAVIYALWLIPALRLLTPFASAELPGLSLPYEWFLQGTEYISEAKWVKEDMTKQPALQETIAPEENVSGSEALTIPEPLPAGESVTGTAPAMSYEDTAGQTVREAPSAGLSRTARLGLLIWLCGSMMVGSCALLSNLRLGRTVRHMDVAGADSPIPVCLSNAVVSPCLFGLIRPRILLNWKVKENQELYGQVLRHELVHYRQKDHIWTFLRILLCVVYWWNPLVWLGAVCSREDAELSCDQRATRGMNNREKKEYGMALLLLLQQTRTRPAILYGATSMHGQGNSLKRRIESITRNTRTRKWVMFPVCLLLIVSLAAGCSMPSADSWIGMDWVYGEGPEGESWQTSTEYQYDFKEDMASWLFYYEIYDQGELVKRRAWAYGSLEDSRKGTQSIVVEYTDMQDPGAYAAKETGENTELTLSLPFDTALQHTDSSILDESGKRQVSAGADLVLLADYWEKQEVDQAAPEDETDSQQGSSVPSCQDLTGKSEEEKTELLAGNDRAVLIHLVLSELPGNELAAQYEALDTSDTSAGDGQDEWNEGEVLAHAWADAFCERDGNTIYDLASEKVRTQMQEETLMDVLEDGTVTFGWSSPWPGMFTDEGYNILFVDEYGAEILYYAAVSDPHVTVWREQLGFERENGELKVTSSNLRFLDDISTSDEFFLAYPGGEITGTEMDYAANGLGVYLNQNAMEQTDMENYQLLKDPYLAVCSLLNLGRPWNEDTEGFPRKVSISMANIDGRNIAQITFLEEQTTVEVQMVQPWGEDGIWIPETSSVSWSADMSGMTDTEAGTAAGNEAAAGSQKLMGPDDASDSAKEESWQPAALTYLTPKWAQPYLSDMEAEKREAQAQKALEELYDLTGYKVESCVYTSTENGGYCFARDADALEHSLVFYDRYFQDEDYGESIPSMEMSSARRVWYSDVQQLRLPGGADQMSAEELAVWFLKESGIYQGEQIAGTSLVFSSDPNLIKVITADGSFYEVAVDMEIQGVSSIYGPYPDGFTH